MASYRRKVKEVKKECVTFMKCVKKNETVTLFLSQELSQLQLFVHKIFQLLWLIDGIFWKINERRRGN